MSTSRMAAGAAGHRRRAAIPDPFAELQSYDEQQRDRFHQQCARNMRRRSSAMRAPAAAQNTVLQICFDEDDCPEFSDGKGIISSSSHDVDDVIGVPADDDSDAYRGGGFGAVPASGVEIASLAEAAVGENEEEEECAVCLEGLAAAGEGEEKQVVIRKMPCPDAHRFHERCIFQWLMVSRLCPLCRFALPPAAEEEDEETDGLAGVAGSDADTETEDE